MWWCARLRYVAAKGLPGEHHFYITFRTDFPGVVDPARLRAQYPQEMTIVLQHQFWDLDVDERSRIISVGLSFGGVPTTLRIPFAAVTQFADPHVRYGLRFDADPACRRAARGCRRRSSLIPPPIPHEPRQPDAEAPQVVSLDAFRRRTPPRES